MATQVETEVIFTERRSGSENVGDGENESAAPEKQTPAREESSPSGDREKSGGCFGFRNKDGPKTRKPPSKSVKNGVVLYSD